MLCSALTICCSSDFAVGSVMKTGHAMQYGIRSLALAAVVAVAGMGMFGVSPVQAQQAAPSAPAGQSTIDKIVVEGAKRIDEETVLSYIKLQSGDVYNPGAVNRALKALYATGLFADVRIHYNDRLLIVSVVENPIINQVAFEGNKRVKDSVLEAEVQLRPRMVYSHTSIQSDIQRILDVYRRSGRFSTRVEPKIIQLEQNRIDLVFEIEEGPETGVHKISFIGNRFFSDGALKDEVMTKETRWYRLFSSVDSYDPDRLAFDGELLRRLYESEGFVDFEVVSSVAELAEDRTGFYITHTLEEGQRYRLSGFDMVSRIKEVDSDTLIGSVKLGVNDWYNADTVNEAILDISNRLGEQGYAFVDVEPILIRDRKNSEVSVVFEVKEAPKVYVERINIQGNTRTEDEVIRREFQLVEGDAFNSAKLERSRQKVSNLGYFKNVGVSASRGSQPDSVVIDTKVEEQSTGELNVGAGYSTVDGVIGEVAVRERNLRGKGQILDLVVKAGQKRNSIDASFTEPHFMNRDLSAGVDVFHITRDNQDTSSYDSKESGAGLRMGYDITEYLRQSLSYQYSKETIDDIDSDASKYVKAQEGTERLSTFGQVLSYDRRNSTVEPTSGYQVSLSNDLSGLGGTVKYFKTRLSGVWYHSFTDEVYMLAGGAVGHITGLDDDEVRLNDRFFVGGNSLRGFDPAGIGPRDVKTRDSLGGNRYMSGTLEVRFPLGLPDEIGMSGALFTDFGTLYEVEETGTDIRDENSLRTSIGVGLGWKSPLGPFRFNFANAINKEDYDQTQTFTMTFGSRF